MTYTVKSSNVTQSQGTEATYRAPCRICWSDERSGATRSGGHDEQRYRRRMLVIAGLRSPLGR